MDPKEVRMVLEQLAVSVTEHLAAKRRVHIDNLGSLTSKEMKGVTRIRDLSNFKKKKQRVSVGRVFKVSFKKATRLKEALR
jgi:nucleoid DNA-binding protein